MGINQYLLYIWSKMWQGVLLLDNNQHRGDAIKNYSRHHEVYNSTSWSLLMYHSYLTALTIFMSSRPFIVLSCEGNKHTTRRALRLRIPLKSYSLTVTVLTLPNMLNKCLQTENSTTTKMFFKSAVIENPSTFCGQSELRIQQHCGIIWITTCSYNKKETRVVTRLRTVDPDVLISPLCCILCILSDGEKSQNYPGNINPAISAWRRVSKLHIHTRISKKWPGKSLTAWQRERFLSNTVKVAMCIMS